MELVHTAAGVPPGGGLGGQGGADARPAAAARLRRHCRHLAEVRALATAARASPGPMHGNAHGRLPGWAATTAHAPSALTSAFRKR